jgi:hypothetical protein
MSFAQVHKILNSKSTSTHLVRLCHISTAAASVRCEQQSANLRGQSRDKGLHFMYGTKGWNALSLSNERVTPVSTADPWSLWHWDPLFDPRGAWRGLPDCWFRFMQVP